MHSKWLRGKFNDKSATRGQYWCKPLGDRYVSYQYVFFIITYPPPPQARIDTYFSHSIYLAISTTSQIVSKIQVAAIVQHFPTKRFNPLPMSAYIIFNNLATIFTGNVTLGFVQRMRRGGMTPSLTAISTGSAGFDGQCCLVMIMPSEKTWSTELSKEC